jgi:hypothetical protein
MAPNQCKNRKKHKNTKIEIGNSCKGIALGVNPEVRLPVWEQVSPKVKTIGSQKQRLCK